MKRMKQKSNNKAVEMKPTGFLYPGFKQPRKLISLEEAKTDSTLCALAQSITERGILQPILARSDGEILAGHRRWMAAQIAGLSEVPVITLTCGDSERVEIILAENVHRKDLAPTELASLLAEMGTQGMSDDEIARRTSISIGTVTTYKAVNKLPQELWPLIDSGELPLGQAKEIGKLPNDARKISAARLAVKQRLTTREVKASVQKAQPTARAQIGYAERRQRDISWAIKLLVEIRTRFEAYRDIEDIPAYAQKIENRLQSVSRDVFTLCDELAQQKKGRAPELRPLPPVKLKGLEPGADHKRALALFNSLQRERFAQLMNGRSTAASEWHAVDTVLRETDAGELRDMVIEGREVKLNV